MTTTTVTRDEIAEVIAGLREKAKRMPAHWVDRQAEIAAEIDCLVEELLALPE